jgi:hypothetical protein
MVPKIKLILVGLIMFMANLAASQSDVGYVSSKDGCWLKNKIDGDNAIYLTFNSKVTLIKDSFPPSSSRKWFVSSAKGKGWLSAGDFGKKWCPEDSAILFLAEKFLERLETKEKLAPLMNKTWNLLYHEDNRCDGSTNGRLYGIPKNDVDKLVKVKVFRDGKGWMECNVEPALYFIDFKLQEKFDKWNTWEVAEIDYCNKTITFGWGGASDYFITKLIKSKNGYLIGAIEYRSEDPG